MINLGKLIRQEILHQRAYQAESVSCPVKLDANENPFSLPSELKMELFRAMEETSLHRYPQAGAPDLRRRLASHLGVAEAMIIIGNGSDELIQILCTVFSRPGSKVLVPVPSFVMYKISSINNGHETIEIPLGETFDLDLDTMVHKIRELAPSIIFLGHPNNPTGNCFSEDTIEVILKESPGIVVLDEAYYCFAGKTFLSLLAKYENLIILRSLSKVGLAAMRLGFLVGSPAVLHELDKVRLPYNINALSQVAVAFFLDHEDVFLAQAAQIVSLREELFAELKEMKEIHVYPTEANFILFRCTTDANQIYADLIRQGVLVRNFNSPGVLERCLRVTVGSREENRRFIEALKRAIT